MPKVSILLPVYNSITRMERTDFLQQTLDSIVNQTHQDIELLILDNQSIDSTVEVCNSIASKDDRIKVFIDSKHRPAEEAQSDLVKIAKGEYVMCMADDDLLNHRYIATLVNALEMNRKIDMAYTNGLYINVNNQVSIGRLISNTDGIYNSEYYYENFYKAIHKRKVLPVVYGIFKKEVFQSLMPYAPFDQLRANMDNLLMAKFFLNKHTISFVDSNLVYYRHRDRSLNAASVDWMPTNPILVWVYYVRHQLYFYNAICFLINETNNGELTEALKITTLDSCLNQCVNLLDWVARDLVEDAFEQNVVLEIFRQFKPIYDLMLPNLAENQAVVRKQQDTNRLRCKILQERVMGYIKNVVQETELVVDTQNVIGVIKEEIIKKLNTSS